MNTLTVLLAPLQTVMHGHAMSLRVQSLPCSVNIPVHRQPELATSPDQYRSPPATGMARARSGKLRQFRLFPASGCTEAVFHSCVF